MDFYNQKYKPVIGERVKLIRKFYGKKQKDFGNESTVSQIENGTKDINANVLFHMKEFSLIMLIILSKIYLITF